MKTKAGELLRNAIDLHLHCYPEVSFTVEATSSDLETLQGARAAGMRGMVFKSHFWPTVGRVYYLRQLVSGIEAFGSITLNVSAGGLSPWAVESAAKQGARVVWMPTWTSAHGHGKGIALLIKRWLPSLETYDVKTPLTVLDSSGNLLPEVKAIVNLAKEYGLVISTGHLSPKESLVLGAEAEKTDFNRLVFGHPLSHSVSASKDQVKEMVARGAMVEMCALNAFSPGEGAAQAAELINMVGAEHCILTTDTFGSWPPAPHEFMRMFISRLLGQGIAEDSIRTMVQANPAKLLGLPYPVPQP